MNNVKTFYVEFSPKHRAQIDAFLRPLISRLFPSAQTHLTIIDTSGECAPAGSFINVIRGDNSSREFSGWQTALDQALVADDDIICLCNDTFARNYGSEFLSWFDRSEIQNALENHAVVGYADAKKIDALLFGLPVRRWVRTSIFFAKGRDLKALLPLTLPVADSEIFAPTGQSLFLPTAPIDERSRQWLDSWLVNGAPVAGESTEKWYQAAPLTDANRAFMHLKAKSILCELYFAAKIRKAGFEIFDVRRSRTRAFGLYRLLDKLKILDRLQSLRRR